MTHARNIRRRSAALALAAMGAALALLPSTAAAKEAPEGAWYGWGAKFAVVNGAPEVTFLTYVAVEGEPTQFLAEQETTMTCQPRGNGTIDYDTTTATFDGNSYLACKLPSWEKATDLLGYDLPDTGECMVCATGGAPVWGSMEVTPDASVSGTMPVIDASVAGIVLNAVGNTVSSRARLDLDRTLGGATTSYYSTTWPTASSPLASTLVGMEGDGIVDVTSHFGWSEFVGGEWQTWFQDEVEGATVGSWEDSGSYDSSLVTGRRYELGIDGGTIYIGYSPSTGRHFEGTIGGAEVDPGCQGL